MNSSPLIISALLLATPLALAQAPGQPADRDPGPMPGPPGLYARQNGPNPDIRGRFERGRDVRMHDEGGPGGFGGMRVPAGTWWRNPEVVSRIGLSPDQVKRIDGIFLESRIQLIHMHASLEEEQLRLEPLLATNPVNEQAALAQISKIADTRANLEKADAKMLLSIRGVLTADQWTKLQEHPFRLHLDEGPAGPNGTRGMRGPRVPAGAPGNPTP